MSYRKNIWSTGKFPLITTQIVKYSLGKLTFIRLFLISWKFISAVLRALTLNILPGLFQPLLQLHLPPKSGWFSDQFPTPIPFMVSTPTITSLYWKSSLECSVASSKLICSKLNFKTALPHTTNTVFQSYPPYWALARNLGTILDISFNLTLQRYEQFLYPSHLSSLLFYF